LKIQKKKKKRFGKKETQNLILIIKSQNSVGD
jgi:hypothetical protein